MGGAPNVTPVYPKRDIFRMLLLLALERGEWSWSGRLTELLAKS